MSIQFSNIPNDVRVPFFYAELDNSRANSAGQKFRSLVKGQKKATGEGVAGAADTLYLINTPDRAKELFGVGSYAARMCEVVFLIDPFCELWAVAADDDEAAEAAEGSIEITGPATASGVLTIYIAGQRVRVGVAAEDTGAMIATALGAAINAMTSLPVTASVSDNVVDLTAVHAGALGNDIKIQPNFYGSIKNEALPAGVSLTVTAMADGAADPDLSGAIAAIGDEEFDFTFSCFSDVSNLDLFKVLMDDTSGRWSYLKQIYGHIYTAKRGTVGDLVTFGNGRNDQHVTVAAMEANMPTPVWEFAAAYGARNAAYIRNDPARPTQTGPMVNVIPAPTGQRFSITERQTLLSNGIATSVFEGGYVRVERAITTYQKNASGQPDDSYLDSETMHQAAFVVRRLRSVVTSKYARYKLGNDGERFGSGQPVLTPKMARAEIMGECARLSTLGMVENLPLINKYMIVERDPNNSNRLNILFPPDFVNQLRVFAVLMQFRLQYPEGS